MSHAVAPSREGWLQKKGASKHTAWRRRFFVLEDNTLKYFKDEEAAKAKGEVDLKSASVTVLRAKRRNKFPFNIHCPSLGRTYLVYAETREDRDNWVRDLQTSIGLLQEDKKNKPRRASASPRQWERPLMISWEFKDEHLVSSHLSEWRRDLSFCGLESGTDDSKLSVADLVVDDCLERGACAAIHDEYNMVAAGSDMGPGSTSFVQLVKIPDRFNARAGVRVSFEEVHNFEMDSGCVDVTWHGDNLLCATFDGQVHLYRCSGKPHASYAPRMFPQQTYIHKVAKNVNAPSPSRWLDSSRVRCVRHNPVEPTFVSTVNNYVHLWRIDRPDAPAVVEMASNQPLFAVDWNPHSGTMFVMGGARRTLKLLDERLLTAKSSKCVVWKVSGAHDDAICDVAWSPLSPNWIASVSEDASVKVWDIRFQKPVRKMQGHTSAVSTVAWSKSHVDMLVTGGVDRTMRLWNLRSPPHFIANTLDQFTGSVLGVGFSPRNPLQYYGYSADGQLIGREMSREFVTQYADHRFHRREDVASRDVVDVGAAASAAGSNAPVSTGAAGGDGGGSGAGVDIGIGVGASGGAGSATSGAGASKLPSTGGRPGDKSRSGKAADVATAEETEELRKIESLLYLRDFSTAFQHIATLATTFWESGRSGQAERLLKLSAPANFDQAASRAYSRSKFDAVLSDLSYFTPASALKWTEVEEGSDQTIQRLKLRLALLRLIEDGKYHDILSLEPEIITQLHNNGDAFDAATLEKMILAVLPHDYLSALQLSFSIGAKLKQVGHFGNFTRIARTLIYPSIYDSVRPDFEEDREHAANAKTMLDREVRNPKKMLSELQLLQAVTESMELVKGSKRIMELVEEQQDPRKILSATVHRLYFNALLKEKCFDKLYIFGSRLEQHLTHYEFSLVMQELMDIARPRFVEFLEACLAVDAHRPWDSEKLVAGALTIINILYNCQHLPEVLHDVLPSHLTQFTDRLREALRLKLAQPSDDSSASSGPQLCESVLQRLASLTDHRHTDNVFFADKIDDFEAMVREFI